MAGKTRIREVAINQRWGPSTRNILCHNDNDKSREYTRKRGDITFSAIKKQAIFCLLWKRDLCTVPITEVPVVIPLSYPYFVPFLLCFRTFFASFFFWSFLSFFVSFLTLFFWPSLFFNWGVDSFSCQGVPSS